MRNTTRFGRLPTSCVSGVVLAVRRYNELSKARLFLYPLTNAPSAQTQVSNHKKADRLMVGREEVCMGKSCRLSNGLNLRQRIEKAFAAGGPQQKMS